MSDIAFKDRTADGASHNDRDQEKFEFFFRQFYAGLCSFAYGYIQNRETAKDMVQSVFLKVWEQKHVWDDPEQAKAFLYTSVRNEALNYLKHEKIKREAHSKIRLQLQEWTERSKSANKDQKATLVLEGVSRLPDRCREIFKLSRESGLTYDEIADVLGISRQTVKTQMERAFKSLRAWVKEHLNEVVLLLAFLLNY